MSVAVLARFFIDSGTESFSNITVNHPSWVYEERVLKWGYIERSIPSPVGLPRIGDATIRIADTDRKFRDKFSFQSPRRRFVELKLVEEGTSESAADPIYKGEVQNVDFGPGYCEIELRDRTFAWIDEPFPNLINRVNYPTLAAGTDEAAMPIVNGECVSLEDFAQGIIPLPHIGYDISTGDRYAAHLFDLEDIAVYRRLPDEGLFSAVDPADYNVTVVPREFAEFPGITFNVTYVDFLVEQVEGAEVSADIWGINNRDAWNGISAATTFEENRNPMNFFINMIHLFMLKAGVSDDVWDVDEIEATLVKFETILSGPSGPSRLLCDGAFTQSITAREWLGQFLPNFELDLYQKKNGKLAVSYVEDTNPSRPLFTAGHDVEIQTFFETLAKPTVNQCRFHFQQNYVSGQFAANEIFDNEADQYALGDGVFDIYGDPVTDPSGVPVRIPRYETEDFNLFWVRNIDTALFTVTRRMSFLALGSFRQTWTMDLLETNEDIELARLIGLTHFDGAELGTGYVNKELKILGLSTDLDKMKVNVSTILRVPQTIIPSYVVPATEESFGDFGFTTSVDGESI